MDLIWGILLLYSQAFEGEKWFKEYRSIEIRLEHFVQFITVWRNGRKRAAKLRVKSAPAAVDHFEDAVQGGDGRGEAGKVGTGVLRMLEEILQKKRNRGETLHRADENVKQGLAAKLGERQTTTEEGLEFRFLAQRFLEKLPGLVVTGDVGEVGAGNLVRVLGVHGSDAAVGGPRVDRAADLACNLLVNPTTTADVFATSRTVDIFFLNAKRGKIRIAARRRTKKYGMHDQDGSMTTDENLCKDVEISV